jgi:hypothetical protein
MAIAQPAIEPATEQVSVVRGIQGVHLSGQVIEWLTVVELTLEGSEGDGQLNRCVEANRAGKLFWNRQRFTQSGHRKFLFSGREQARSPCDCSRGWAGRTSE